MKKTTYNPARLASLILALAGAPAGLKASETGTLITSDTTPIHTSDLGVTVTAPAAGDLFLAFRATGGQGASLSYIVNIGSDLTYRNAAPGSSFTIAGIGDIGADLLATYGNTWSTRSDLFWGVFGARQAVSSTVYASREQDPAGTASTAWSPLTQTARNSTATSIIDVVSGIGGYTGSTSTDNSPVGILQTNSSSESSYNKQVSTAGTTDFGSLSQWSSIEGDFGSGAAGTALDLYRIAGTQASNLGTFTIGDTGALTFTAAVPEPGSAALLVLGGSRSRRTAPPPGQRLIHALTGTPFKIKPQPETNHQQNILYAYETQTIPGPRRRSAVLRRWRPGADGHSHRGLQR